MKVAIRREDAVADGMVLAGHESPLLQDAFVGRPHELLRRYDRLSHAVSLYDNQETAEAVVVRAQFWGHFLNACQFVELLCLYDRVHILLEAQCIRNHGLASVFGDSVASIPVQASDWLTKGVELERSRAVPFYPNTAGLDTYIKLCRLGPRVLATSLLDRAFRALARGEAQLHQQLQSAYGYCEFIIPPIMALVLDQIDKPSQILDEAMELRHRFAPFRQRRFELNDLMVADLPRRTKLKKERALKRSIRRLLAKYDKRDSELAAAPVTQGALVELTGALGVTDLTSDWELSLAGLAKRGKRFVAEYLARRRIRPLFYVQRKLDYIGTHGRLFEKIWGFEFSPVEFGCVTREARRMALTSKLLELSQSEYHPWESET